MCYDSEEKFDAEKFQCLIRTCNVKKLLKGEFGDTRRADLEAIEGARAKRHLQFSQLLFEGNSGDMLANMKQPFLTPQKEAYYVPATRADRTLVFESRFESGNLQVAQKLSDYEYNLVLQNDINSKGHT